MGTFRVFCPHCVKDVWVSDQPLTDAHLEWEEKAYLEHAKEREIYEATVGRLLAEIRVLSQYAPKETFDDSQNASVSP